MAKHRDKAWYDAELARLDALINQRTVAGDRYSDQANREVDTEVFAPA